MPVSEIAKRARKLLDQKVAKELPTVSKKRGPALRESSADTFFSGLVEGAFLVAAADGEMSDEEESTLGETINHVTGEPLEPAEFMEMLDSFAQALDDDGLHGRITALAKALPDDPARREVLAFSILVALCDRNLAASEKKVLIEMGNAFGIYEDEIEQIIASIEASLGPAA